jgi:flavodoxin
MKALVVYYTRTGTTKKIAEEIQTLIDADIDEVNDKVNRSGLIGWLKAGRDAGAKNLTTITNIEKEPGDYEIVIIGSPTWNGTITSPIRTYIDQYGLNLRKVACFTTGDAEKPVALDEMKRLLGEKILAKIHLVRKKDILTDNYHEKLNKFIKEIKENML